MGEWHEIAYPISLQYRKHWGEWEAIREIVQNALDECGDFEVIQDGQDTIIRDSGSGLAVKHLLFGVSEKKSKDSRGRFGEGLKIALVVLKRLGYDVTIRSNGLEVKTATHEIEGEQCLKLLYRRIDNHVNGTEVIIHGYQGSVFEDRFTTSKNPVWRGTTIWGDKAEIYEEDQPKLYVKDIYVQDLPNAMFSYNLWDVKLEESRNIADSWSLSYEIGRLWENVDDYYLLVKFMQAIKLKKWEYHNCYFDYPSKHPKKFVRAFKEVFGQNAFIKCTDVWTTEAEWQGGRAVELPSELQEGFIKSGIPTDEAFVLMKSGRQRIPIDDSELSRIQLENLLRLRKVIKELAKYRGELKDVQVKAFRLPPDENGVWMRHANTIAISKDALDTYFTAFDPFHHELAHALYNAPDGTHAMIRALSKCAALIAVAFNIPGKVRVPKNPYKDFKQRILNSSQ